MRNKLWLIPVIALLIIAVLLVTVVTGHMYIALICLLAASLIVIYRFGARTLKIIISAMLIIGIVIFTIIEIPIIKAARTDAPSDCGYIVVLGAGLHGDVPSLSLRNRLDAALAWLNAHPDCKAVVTGGQGPGESMTEAEAMGIWLEAKGIEPRRIILETESSSTWENLENSFALIRKDGGEPDANIAIVTSEYHLCRAKLMAGDLGVEAYGIAGHTSWPTLMVNYFIREALGVTYYRLFGGQ